MHHTEDAAQVLSSPGRFQAPQPVDLVPNMTALVNVCCPTAQSPCTVWAATYSLKLHHECKVPDASRCIVITDMDEDDHADNGDAYTISEPGTTCYFIAEKNYTASRLIKCSLSDTRVDGDQKIVATIILPLQVISAVELFSGFYDNFQDESIIERALLERLRLATSSHAMTWRYAQSRKTLFAEVELKGVFLFTVRRARAACKICDLGGQPEVAAAAQGLAASAASSSSSSVAPSGIADGWTSTN